LELTYFNIIFVYRYSLTNFPLDEGLFHDPLRGVDKRFEISNLDLIRDMERIIKLEEVLPTHEHITF